LKPTARSDPETAVGLSYDVSEDLFFPARMKSLIERDVASPALAARFASGASAIIIRPAGFWVVE
jgi:hypothetical protein